MKILVINAGSSSLKYQLLDMDTESVVAKGLCERIGIEGSKLTHKPAGKDEVVICREMESHTVAIKMVLDALTDKNHGVVKSMSEIGAVGHRIVHSAEDFKGSVILTEEVMNVCEGNAELAPLHQPANICGIRACREVMPSTPMVGVFDTAFHSNMPEKAYLYGIPYEAYKDWKVRRYGFHGTSHQYVSQEAAKFMGRDLKDLKIVTCHLGNGSSISAVKDGISIDTSMGFTPLEGVPMGTRSGDIDPSVVEYVMAKGKMTAGEVLSYFNKKSGMLGLSGLSSDFRDLTAAAEQGNKRAALALDVFSYRVKKYVGAYMAAMGGCDAIVFTAGVGENTMEVRQRVLDDMEFFGVTYDRAENKKRPGGKILDLTGKDSRVKVLVVPTNEELVIARETLALVK